ncbi:DUF551 domain-containing protein [Escherichia coli]|nr:hypothetical protein BMT97_16180 [Escherichia coli]RCY87763.1 DUF551 domain-containing protein [Escherichia coli]RCZ27504.1 DUF551 domain-containing protein [Escherichia coli]HAI2468401.1 DUF551 domain-containing protein [Escherichia coli]HAL2764816.1 DUF551 domain-containing protein [Escherichia coli]
MITITKERLLTIKQWRETYGPGSNVVLPAEEAEELARIALASLEAEPVAECIVEDGGMCIDGFGEYVGHSLPDGTHQLYTAPPAPVVPEEKPMPNPLSMYAVDAVAAIAEVRGWNACRAAMLHAGNFRKNANSSTNNFREIAETSTNSPVIPGEVLSAILKFARVRADFDDFDGDRRGIGDCLDEAEQELIVTINKYASQLAAEPIATNDVREQQTAVPPIQADVAQAIENLKQKLVECNRYNYCADAVKGVEDACRAAMLHGAEHVSNRDELPLGYLQGQKDGLEWAAQLAEANHPQTGDWLYDDPIDLARAIRKGPDMPTVQGGNSPVTPDAWISCSERMPDDAQWCVVNTKYGYYVQCWSEGQGWLGDDISIPECDVINWMPLPEPPQEVK